jgi:hypothetical protein
MLAAHLTARLAASRTCSTLRAGLAVVQRRQAIAGTEWCMFLHEGYCVSGSAIVQAEDGTETRIGPGDGYVIQPGHDAWVVGDEPWVTVDLSQAMADYAKPS